MIKNIKAILLKKAIFVASNISDENLINLLKLSQKIITDKKIKGTAKTIENLFKNKHPSIVLTKKLFSNLSKKPKEKFIENFLINQVIIGSEIRNKNSKKLGFTLPWFFVLSPTARCNLHCIGCYAGEYQKEQDVLSFEEIDRIFREAKELGFYFIVISGGEPFIRKDLLDLFEKHNDIYFMVYTNGTLIDEKLAKKLAELGNVAPAISVEGFEKETDARRGSGIFQRVLSAMENLKKNGVLFGFSATPTIKNSDILVSDEFIDFFIDKGCLFGWYFQYVPIGRNPDTSLMALPEQRNRLRERVAYFRQTKPIFIGDFWNDGPYVGGCMAGARPNAGYFHINSNGDVEPCVFLQFSVDNIIGKKLVEVIHSPFFQAIQKEQPYCQNGNLLSPCALIDNPWVLRKLYQEYKPKPSYPGIEKVVKDPQITKSLDNYAKEYKKIVDPIWERDLSKRFKHWKQRL
jgi:MoaA/NifB/PqqE/SkfB family radical SAM enzyme